MNTKILIIEDDRSVVETLLLIFNLQWPEAQVVFSYLGEQGIELARTENPDAIILDLGLPDISGFKVIKEVRLFSSIPIIVLTAHSAEEEIVKALEEEATDYVIKPFKHRELLARLEAHINYWKKNELRALTQRAIKENK
jgi:DNA-binding response OmpR family regulator